MAHVCRQILFLVESKKSVFRPDPRFGFVGATELHNFHNQLHTSFLFLPVLWWPRCFFGALSGWRKWKEGVQSLTFSFQIEGGETNPRRELFLTSFHFFLSTSQRFISYLLSGTLSLSNNNIINANFNSIISSPIVSHVSTHFRKFRKPSRHY